MREKFNKFVDDNPDTILYSGVSAMFVAGYILGKRRKPKNINNIYLLTNPNMI